LNSAECVEPFLHGDEHQDVFIANLGRQKAIFNLVEQLTEIAKAEGHRHNIDEADYWRQPPSSPGEQGGREPDGWHKAGQSTDPG